MLKGYTDLASRMKARADADGLPETHELRTTAQAFEEAAECFFKEDAPFDPAAITRTWIKARRVWCAYVGEPLL